MNFLHYYRRYLQYAAKDRPQYIGMWLVYIIYLAIDNSIIYFIGGIVDSIQEFGDIEFANLLPIVGVMLLLTALEPWAMVVKARLQTLYWTESLKDTFANILSQDYGYHANKSSGKIISILLKARSVASIFAWKLETHFVEFLFRIVTPIALVATLDWRIGLTMLITTLICVPIFYWSIIENVRRRVVMRDASYDVDNIIVDSISAYETVKSFNNVDRELANIQSKVQEMGNANISYQWSFRYMDAAVRFGGLLIFMTSAYVGTVLASRGILSLGEYVVVVTYSISLPQKLLRVMFSVRNIVSELPVAEDYNKLYDAEAEITDSENAVDIGEVRGDIKFEDVSFAYSKDGKQVLEGLNLEIKPNQHVALVGPSGGGKSTITKALMRYYDVDSGGITVDGYDIRDVKLNSLTANFGLVPQEPVLFNRSIYYNVGYSLNGIEKKRKNPRHKKLIAEACKAAQIHDFIMTLPKGYDTEVGERGVKLSGGQKQRIAIARVLLRDPEIIVFDEATSMLDSESEKAIQKAFKSLGKDKTVIIIAHRLSTIVHCDNIFVIDEGQVVENGTHNSLLKQKGLYKELWDIQSGGFES